MTSFSESETGKLKNGIRLFQEGHYFDAHDEWEEVWQELNGRKKIFWQSLIQISVSCYHIENGNFKGASGMIEKAEQKIVSLKLQKIHPCIIQMENLIQHLKIELQGTTLTKEIILEMNNVINENLLNFE